VAYHRVAEGCGGHRKIPVGSRCAANDAAIVPGSAGGLSLRVDLADQAAGQLNNKSYGCRNHTGSVAGLVGGCHTLHPEQAPGISFSGLFSYPVLPGHRTSEIPSLRNSVNQRICPDRRSNGGRKNNQTLRGWVNIVGLHEV
jgi:hypothetical protein